MLPTLLHELDVLSSSRVPQLIVSLAICGGVLVVASDWPLGVPALLAQRAILVALLWSTMKLPLATTMMVASVAIALIYGVSQWRLWRMQARAAVRTEQTKSSLGHIPLDGLAAALGLLVSYGLVKTYRFHPLPPMVAFAVVLLVVNGLLILLLADTAVRTGMGILTFTDGCRILYTLLQPTPLVWGLWAVCDVVVALAASHLRNSEVAAQGQAAEG